MISCICLLSSCSAAKSGPLPGAPSSSVPAGPTQQRQITLPPIADRLSPSARSTPSPVSAEVRGLTTAVTAALTATDRVPPLVEISQKAAAGNQVLVAWTVSTDPADALAAERVRTDSIAILATVKATHLDYGSVLLVATGATRVDGKRKVKIVVRAKYTRSLVLATDWVYLTPAEIFTLPDDKPATIDPAYR